MKDFIKFLNLFLTCVDSSAVMMSALSDIDDTYTDDEVIDLLEADGREGYDLKKAEDISSLLEKIENEDEELKAFCRWQDDPMKDHIAYSLLRLRLFLIEVRNAVKD